CARRGGVYEQYYYSMDYW
nr:immunoglobulin heavy chain junction region [Mus musculus]